MLHLRVIYRPGALGDLERLYRYIVFQNQDLRYAQGFVRRIKARCSAIGYVPFGGTPRDDLMSGLRTIAFERSTLIAYRVANDRVEITNIFYGGRDYEALFRPEAPAPDDAE